MIVTLKRVDGTDLDVVNAARGSYDKQHAEFVPGKDDGLIAYLGRERHEQPFGHVGLSLHVKAPLFVARQLWKSHVGCVGGDAGTPAWSEVSRRYVDSAPEIWEPDVWRKRAPDKKQGSLDESVDMPGMADLIYGAATDKALEAYGALLNIGVTPELARAVLPASILTQWRWTGSLLFFARVVGLRRGAGAQKEAGMIAAQIAAIAAEAFPVSWPALMGDPA